MTFSKLLDLQILTVGQLNQNGELPDGRDVLRFSMREFLISEALWSLGIPTSRAASLVTTNLDEFKDTENLQTNCASVLRVAPTFLRFNTMH